MTAPLPSATARGMALRRDVVALGIAASCEGPDLWAASRDCSTGAFLWTKARVAPEAPDLVAWPEDPAEVAALVRFAAANAVPVVATGGGTRAAGGALPLRGGIVLDTKRLVEPFRIDLPGNCVEAGAGVMGQRLEERLAWAGATLGHLPGSGMTGTVGGSLATRDLGFPSTRYGSASEVVLAVEAVDGTGELLRTLDGPSAGPDLLGLLLGSEGTLAIFTSARLRIWPRPRERWLRAVRFPSLAEAVRAIRDVLRSGLQPSIVRLQDPLDTLLAATGAARVPQPLRWLVEGAQAEATRISLRAPVLLNKLVDALPEASLAVLEFEGAVEGDAGREGEAALAICARASGEVLGAEVAARCLASADRVRWAQAPLVAAGAFVETLDVATTWERAEPLYRAVRRAAEDLAFVRIHFSHAAPEGCAVQVRLVGLAGAPADVAAGRSPDDAEADLAEARRRSDAAIAAVLDAAADAGATISHHSGIGASRQVLLRRELGEGIRQLRALKRAFDPQGILNPGKALL